MSENLPPRLTPATSTPHLQPPHSTDARPSIHVTSYLRRGQARLPPPPLNLRGTSCYRVNHSCASRLIPPTPPVSRPPPHFSHSPNLPNIEFSNLPHPPNLASAPVGSGTDSRSFNDFRQCLDTPHFFDPSSFNLIAAFFFLPPRGAQHRRTTKDSCARHFVPSLS